MPLDPEFLNVADRFLAFVARETGHPSIVCDERGTIVRATVRSRVGSAHAGAQRILRGECAEAEVTAEEAAENPQVKEGFSCPIVSDGARIGTFGITGPIAITRPLGRVAAMVLASWVSELEHRRAVHATAARVFASLDQLGARADTARTEVASGAAAIAAAVRTAQDRIEGASGVARSVQRIALQSRILSINGSVEATRAGDAGRSFAVVAKDMTRLAEETKAASGEIETALGGVGQAVTALSGAVERASRSTAAQGAALADSTATMHELKDTLDRLDASFGAGTGGR